MSLLLSNRSTRVWASWIKIALLVGGSIGGTLGASSLHSGNGGSGGAISADSPDKRLSDHDAAIASIKTDLANFRDESNRRFDALERYARDQRADTRQILDAMLPKRIDR